MVGGRYPVFTTEQEAVMTDQVKLLGRIFYGYTSIQIRNMTYQYAVKNNFMHNVIEHFGKDCLKQLV